MVSASGITLALFAAAPLISTYLFHEPEMLTPLRILALAIVPGTLAALYNELLKALKLIGRASFLQSGLPPILMLLFLTFAITLGMQINVTVVALLSVLGAIMSLALAWRLWYSAAPEIRNKRGSFDGRRLLDSSIPLLWVSGMNLIISSTDTVMLGIWMESEVVGLYRAAAQMAMLTGFSLITINTVAAPKFSALYAGGKIRELAALARGCASITTLASIPLLGIFFVMPDTILRLYGEDFAAGSNVLLILAIGQIVNVACGSVGMMLIMTGHEKAMRNAVIGSGFLNIALNALLIPDYGIVGAAIATAISVAALNLVSVLFVYRKMSFLMFAFIDLFHIGTSVKLLAGRWIDPSQEK